MKAGKRPTLRQKKLLKKARLNVDNWLVTKNLPDRLHIVNRLSGKERVLKARRTG